MLLMVVLKSGASFEAYGRFPTVEECSDYNPGVSASHTLDFGNDISEERC